MKLILTIGLAFLFATTAYSQINKGTWTIGGTGSFAGSFGSSREYLYLSLSPSAGYFPVDNWLVGGSLYGGYSKSYFSASAYTAGVGLNSRYYFNIGKEKTSATGLAYQSFSIFPDIGLSYVNSNSFSNSFSNTVATVGLGASVFLTSNFALEAVLSYAQDFGGLGIQRYNFSMPIGFTYYFRK